MLKLITIGILKIELHLFLAPLFSGRGAGGLTPNATWNKQKIF